VPKKNRAFVMDERVKIVKKSHVIDRERAHEGLAEAEREPIEADVTGAEGVVTAPPYENPQRGETFVPIKLENGAVVSVPEKRLERVKVGAGSRAGAKVGYSREYEKGYDRAFRGRNRQVRSKKG
jgi:hypothetical protein